jgi:excisionase family DNA binding protein
MSIDFYSEKAAARVLNIHFDTLRRWRKQGRIRHYRSPTGRISYRFDDLMQFATATPVEPTASPCPSASPGPVHGPEIVYPFGRPAIRR